MNKYTTEELDAMRYALAKQLPTAYALESNYGAVSLDEELREVIQEAIAPIIEARIAAQDDHLAAEDFDALIDSDTMMKLEQAASGFGVDRRTMFAVLHLSRDELQSGIAREPELSGSVVASLTAYRQHLQTLQEFAGYAIARLDLVMQEGSDHE